MIVPPSKIASWVSSTSILTTKEKPNKINEVSSICYSKIVRVNYSKKKINDDMGTAKVCMHRSK
jgi:hypothetical protein